MRIPLLVFISLESAILFIVVGAITACGSSVEVGDAMPRDAGPDGSGPPGDGGLGDTGGNPSDAGPGDGGDGGVSDSGAMTDGVPIFVAHGYAGRTTVSCDDGQTWTANTSLDDSIRCFGTDGPDCDHHPGRAKGIVYSRGWFVATYGWGQPGSVKRSQDGVTWESTFDEAKFGGIAASATHLMAGARNSRFSADLGATWGDPSLTMLEGWNVRRAGFADHDGGRFILVGDGGDVTLSSDDGVSWWRPSTVPEGCGAGIQNSGGIAYLGGAASAIIIVGGNGSVCRSTDGGTTFSMHSTGASRITSSEVVVADGRFLLWGEQARFESTDGVSWARTALTPGIDVGAVERSSSGTFVAVNAGWRRWYEDQRFYRSADGITWEELPRDAYVGSHPIFQIRFGHALPSAACPAPSAR